jgi:acyl-coenzyme A thioesterase PaaI-like protein
MPADADALTVEYKINLLRPAQGESFVARAHVIKSGRTLTFCHGEVVASSGESETVVATMMGTIMTMVTQKSG